MLETGISVIITAKADQTHVIAWVDLFETYPEVGEVVLVVEDGFANGEVCVAIPTGTKLVQTEINAVGLGLKAAVAEARFASVLRVDGGISSFRREWFDQLVADAKFPAQLTQLHVLSATRQAAL